MSYVQEMFDLTGKTVVVTGGAGVIPKAMSVALLNAGATVALWGRGTNHPVADAVAELQKETGAGERVFGVTVDTADAQACVRALAETEAKAGLPAILVNGVGGNMGKAPLHEFDLDLFRKIVDINLFAGLVIPTQLFLRRWIEAGAKASIINISSMAAYTPLTGVAAYAASKAGVANLTNGVANEYAKYGIRCNGISPGFFLGNQNRALLVANNETGELTDRGKQIISRTPFGRFGAFDDLAGVTLFLASDAASGFITGVTIPVDGGYLVGNI